MQGNCSELSGTGRLDGHTPGTLIVRNRMCPVFSLSPQLARERDMFVDRLN
jgi:hypothetical protein